MRKILKGIIILMVIALANAKADEGMWVLPLLEKLNMETMQQMGLQLTAEEIYSLNESSMKDAIVIFGRGCTGEMISDKGLLLTNHHCGYGQIQELSTLENNYLDNGFWAANLEEELHAPGLTATFMKWMRDVTDDVLSVVEDGMNEQSRQAAINERIRELTTAEQEDSGYQIQIRDFFAGNQYFMVAYEVFNDVRMVGVPPSSIGKYGYDTDNWMWPRHTGDFALFRVYADADGNPAEYSRDNIPYQPKHHLPISIKGYEKGDYAMTLGYPGSTQRYLSSWGIEERMNIFNQTLIDVRGVKQDIWAEAMAENDKVRLQYATKFSRSSNYWKNSIGMNRGLEALNVLDQKRELENEFAQWVNQDESRKERYGAVLAMLEQAYENRADHYKANNYMRETLLRGTELLFFASNARELENALKDGNEEGIQTAISDFRERAEEFYRDYHAPLDRKVMAAMLREYAENIPEEFHPKFFKEIPRRHQGDYEAMASYFFSRSFFVNQDDLNAFLDRPRLRRLLNDPAYKAGISTFETYRELLRMNQEAERQLSEANRLFIAGLKEMKPDKVFYPDANFTMRLSYGTVGDYEPRDAVIYKHYTTLEGVMEKEDPDNFEFYVPEKLKQLHRDKNYGRYADADGRMYVNFTTNNDITGGNSGSPVINGNGELIGLAFDGNWEAMSGDIAFEPELQKCINVDIRYVLFIIDKFAGAGHLIEEMTIVE
ncbi:S46 family peptidase [Natronoflexus pectinivorans]|uniref:Dipeptidyl-peptidase n=1 Tax=Natronoflexus pectinivorans TaxID=682526 RepID=A0A4R2GHL1_9BACT|nr:S46 family peptidase [Natronoflexus pectinivorans]TCO07915.1 peptidase S46-like protein [Natronoflexus pectinivorans]